MITKKDFPARIYVYADEDGDTKYLLLHETLEECSIVRENQSQLVAIYNLEYIGELLTSVSLIDV